ncbi:unnamed protein product [Ascophyllum nodosum]
MYLQQQAGLCSREGIQPVPRGAPDYGGESSIPSLCKMWRGSGWFLAYSHCHDTSHQQVPPRHATSGSCLMSPSTESPPSCLIARLPGVPQIHGVLVLCSPESYHSSLHCRTFQRLKILQELFPTVRVEGAREL